MKTHRIAHFHPPLLLSFLFLTPSLSLTPYPLTPSLRLMTTSSLQIQQTAGKLPPTLVKNPRNRPLPSSFTFHPPFLSPPPEDSLPPTHSLGGEATPPRRDATAICSAEPRSLPEAPRGRMFIRRPPTRSKLL